ncbi:MAG TPA: hypothetical protein VHE59_03270 [Mucilaginibacter sp.]|nr:hypothetical protein [Mucilaginibacter sp.]
METAGVNQILTLFNRLSKKEQLAIADQIDKQTFAERWRQIDAQLPDVKFSDEEIMNEVRAVRHERKKD